jgi:hypothetical protein
MATREQCIRAAMAGGLKRDAAVYYRLTQGRS